MPSLFKSLARGRASLEARFRYPLVSKVRKRGLTYLSNARLISLLRHVQRVAHDQQDPLVIEFGVALGGSSILMSDALKRAGKGHFFGYDMFGLIPAPSDRDEADAHKRYDVIVSGKSSGLKGKAYYGYETDLKRTVVENFGQFGLQTGHNIHLIAGDFRDTFETPNQPIDLMHIDCDWHDSVVFCLEAAYAHLRAGGFIFVDDYNDYKGCKVAVDAFLDRYNGLFKMVTVQPHAIIQRVGGR